jgi:hypothetical protein
MVHARVNAPSEAVIALSWAADPRQSLNTHMVLTLSVVEGGEAASTCLKAILPPPAISSWFMSGSKGAISRVTPVAEAVVDGLAELVRDDDVLATQNRELLRNDRPFGRQLRLEPCTRCSPEPNGSRTESCARARESSPP